MRLAILSSHPVQYYGPLFRRLAQRIEVEVLFAHQASPADQARAGFGTAFGWDVDITSGYSHTFLRNVARRPGTDHFLGCDTPEIGARLREGHYNGVLLMGWHLKSYVQGLLVAKRLRLPIMVRGDSQLQTSRSLLKRGLKTLAYPPFLRLFDAGLFVGQRSKAYLTHYGYPGTRLFFSPHCVDNDWFAARATVEARASLRTELGLAENTPVALFAGKLVRFKRPVDVIEAAAQVRAEGTPLEVLVAGDGELRDALRARAEERSVPLHHLGFCNQSRMPAAYAAADVLVLPSERETWGLVANEALACGRPILVSESCGCAPDLASDGAVGRSFVTGDVAALAISLAAVLAKRPAAGLIAEVAGRYSLDAAVEGIVQAALSVGLDASRAFGRVCEAG